MAVGKFISSNIKQRTMENGIHVIVDTSFDAQTVAIDIAARVGSCDEHDVPFGTAHFLEHMAFKGTARRSSDAIHGAITATGGYLNASTDWDTTSFQCLTLEEDFDTAIDVLADIIQNATLNPSDIELEKKVIREELRSGSGSRAVLDECLLYAAYEDQALSRPIIGLEDSISEINADLLHGFRQDHYASENLIVSVAGPIDIERVCEEVGKNFSNSPRGKRMPMNKFHYHGGEQGYACSCERGVVKYAFDAPHPSQKESAAAALFKNVVGYGPSSRLNRELREKRGLVYSVETSTLVMCNSSLTVFETEGHASKIKDIFLLMDEVIYSATETLIDEELETAKRQLITWERMQRDSMQSRCSTNLFDYIVEGIVMDPSEVHAKLLALTVDDVKLAGRSLVSGAASLAIHGPARGMPKLSHLPQRNTLKAA